MTRPELLLKYWPGMPERVSLIPFYAFGDCSRDICYWWRSSAEFGGPGSVIHFPCVENANYFLPLIQAINPSSSITVQADVYQNPPPFHSMPFLKPLTVGYRPLPFDEPKKPSKLLIHHKPVPSENYTSKIGMWSNRFYSQTLFDDLTSEIIPRFQEVYTCGAEYDLRIPGIQHITFKNIEHAIREVKSASLILGEVSYLYALATRCNAPMITVSLYDDELTNLGDAAGYIAYLHNCHIVINAQKYPALSVAYEENRDNLRPRIASIMHRHVNWLSTWRPDYQRQAQLSPSFMSVLQEHFDTNAFMRLRWVLDAPSDGPSKFVCPLDVDANNAAFVLDNLLVYNDLIEHVNELCKTYRRIYFWNNERLKRKHRAVYVESQHPESSGLFKYNLRYDKMVSSYCPAIKYLRINERD